MKILYLTDLTSLCSSSATFLRMRIVSALVSSHHLPNSSIIPPNIVYQYPTVLALSSFLRTILEDPSAAELESPRDLIVRQMCELEQRYCSDVRQSYSSERPLTEFTKADSNSRIVLLTGVSGNIGVHILVRLLEDDRVSRVYGLTRSNAFVPPRERLRLSLLNNQLPDKYLDSPKFAMLVGSYAQPNLGIDSVKCEEVQIGLHF